MSKIVTKMSVKTLGANPARAKTDNKSVDLVRIYGIASGLAFKADPKTGDIQTAVTGSFEGVNLETGEVYSSGVLWLPGGIQELLVNAVDTGETDKNDKPVYNSVKFGFTISSVPATNPIGYSYTAEQLIDAAKNDPLADLRSEMPALPAPTKK